MKEIMGLMSKAKEMQAKFQAMLNEVNKSTQEALDPMAPGRHGGT